MGAADKGDFTVMRCPVLYYIELKRRQAINRINILGSSSKIRQYRRRLLLTRASLAFLNRHLTAFYHLCNRQYFREQNAKNGDRETIVYSAGLTFYFSEKSVKELGNFLDLGSTKPEFSK